MEPEGSIPSSQKLSTGSYPDIIMIMIIIIIITYY
jgi:hypothetical protein